MAPRSSATTSTKSAAKPKSAGAVKVTKGKTEVEAKKPGPKKTDAKKQVDPKKSDEKKSESKKSNSKNVSQPRINIDLSTWLAKGRPMLREGDAEKTPDAPNGGDRDATEAATRDLRERLRRLQDRMIAESAQSLLLVLQAMDTGGKDGTVKNIYAGINPTMASVHSFSVPSEEELAHDFLWRIHARTPGKGMLTVFNRSHYEDVLAVRVRNIAPPAVWRPRFDIINNFEKGLHANNTTVLKIMLHISADEQKARLQARIDRPEKRWKFRMGDIEDRKLWGDYKRAYQDAIDKTNTDHSPWYVVPADKKWYRDFAVMSILVGTLEKMNPKYPTFDNLDGIVVP